MFIGSALLNGQSFQGGIRGTVADTSGEIRVVRLTGAEADARRDANETRWAGIVESLEDLGLEPVVIDSADPDVVYAGVEPLGKGHGTTKQAAEQESAKDALTQLGQL